MTTGVSDGEIEAGGAFRSSEAANVLRKIGRAHV